MKIAITGTIASGKSYLSEVLRRKGFVVYDADVEAKKCYLPHHKGYEEIIDLFGSEIVEDGHIDLRKIADKIFMDKSLRIKLEQIIHPIVCDEIKECALQTINQPFFAEVSVLFHTDLPEFFDEIVVVTCDKDIAIQRCIDNRGYSYEEAIRRYNNQMSPDEQIERADKVFYNNGTIDEFENQIDEWLKEIGC